MNRSMREAFIGGLIGAVLGLAVLGATTLIVFELCRRGYVSSCTTIHEIAAPPATGGE